MATSKRKVRKISLFKRKVRKISLFKRKVRNISLFKRKVRNTILFKRKVRKISLFKRKARKTGPLFKRKVRKNNHNMQKNRKVSRRKSNEGGKASGSTYKARRLASSNGANQHCSKIYSDLLIFTFIYILQYSVSSDKRNVLEEMAKHLLEPANKGQRSS